MRKLLPQCNFECSRKVYIEKSVATIIMCVHLSRLMETTKAFEEAFASTLADPELLNRIQNVKDALYRRSYVEAFASRDRLQAYVVRWSPSRAIAYEHVFSTKKSIAAVLNPSRPIKVLCIGGGAGAEIAALSGRTHRRSVKEIVTIDMGNWEPVVKPLSATLQFLNVKMINGDALEVVPRIPVQEFSMITCLFTTNELVQQSKAGFMKLLQSLNACKPGSILVVIESAGSFSEVSIGTKTFPVYFLLHYTLTHKQPAKWELVEAVDSEWFRLPEGLNYPLELQNMRYFLRVYKRNYID